MSFFRSRLSQNTFALLLSNGGSAFLSFLFSVLIGRILGGHGLGTYATVLAWIFPLSMISEFGLGTLITRDVAQSLENAHAYLQASVIAKLVIGSGLIALLWFSAPFLSDDILVRQGLRLSSPLIVILPLYSSFTAIFRARQIMKPIAFLNLGMLISQVLFTVIILFSGGDILAVFVVNLVTSTGQLIVAWMIYRAKFYKSSKRIFSALAMIKKASPFAIAAILAAIQARMNIILLEQFTDTAQVGYFAAALRFIEAGRMLPHAFFDALFPLLAGLTTNRDKFEKQFLKIMIGLLVFGLLFGLGMWLIGDELIHFTYGDSFESATIILMISAWSLLPMLLKSGRTLYWYARGEENFVNWVTGFVIMVQIPLAIWLIPIYGAIGAAIVTIIVEIIAFSLLMLRR